MNIHKNARMTVHGRVLLVERVEVEGWRVSDAARSAGVSERTAYKWLDALGIIPALAPRYCLSQGSFWIFDEDRVQVEGVSAGLDITQPREVAVHVKAFGLLQRSAVYGPAARELIQAAFRQHQDADSSS